ITGETDEVFGPHTAPPTEDHTIRNIPPRYPREAARRGEQGRVVLLLRIGTEGAVLNAAVYQTSGSPDLDAAAMKAVMSWHFHPAQQDGFPVESTIPYSFTFELTDRREDVH
ncbi:energy transducer TonB, partial [Acidisphaera rubrifaciens]|uniref:energy transducer TonB n=1 Tax=Acidisphaera rubrifaciens TaxID=50715 RepID=UPI000662901E